MSKIYTETHTEKFMCECMGKPCDYYDKCEYPPVYCDSHYEGIIEVKEFIKGMRNSGMFSFKSLCRRDDEALKTTWNEWKLKEFVAMSNENFPELHLCDYETLKAELQELGIWED